MNVMTIFRGSQPVASTPPVAAEMQSGMFEGTSLKLVVVQFNDPGRAAAFSDSIAQITAEYAAKTKEG